MGGRGDHPEVMATQNYDSFINNEHNPFVEQARREASNPVKGRESQPLFGAPNEDAGHSKAAPHVDDSENDEGAPNSGFVIHVATEPGKGEAIDYKHIFNRRHH